MKLFRAYQKLPSGLRERLEMIPYHFFSRRYFREVEKTFNAGPPYRPSHCSVIIDITEKCDLGCIDCSRSCADYQAPSEARMTLEQIRRFIDESRDQRRKWEIILVEGGEPTLHPELPDILDLLLDYINQYTPRTVLQVNTNGYSESSRGIMDRIPPGVNVYDSGKTGRNQEDHLLFNIAPVDLAPGGKYDFSQGCYLPAFYGPGLNRYGYYPHPNCGAIDRVFGFDIGRKSLPEPDDDLGEQFSSLCRYCGMFFYFNKAVSGRPLSRQEIGNPIESRHYPPGYVSESWKEAYRQYALRGAGLSEY